MPVQVLFENLLQKPLAAVAAPADGRCRLIVIDALDECEAGGKNALLDLIAKRFGSGALPPWLRLVVTSRPERVIVDALQKFQPKELECDANQGDARAYLQHMLAGKVAPADADAATELLLARSEGLFQYLAFVCERLQIVGEDCPAALEDLESFPISLSSVYENDFRRAFGSAESSDWHDAQALLAMVFAAQEPLPAKVRTDIAHAQSMITRAMNMNPRACYARGDW